MAKQWTEQFISGADEMLSRGITRRPVVPLAACNGCGGARAKHLLYMYSLGSAALEHAALRVIQIALVAVGRTGCGAAAATDKLIYLIKVGFPCLASFLVRCSTASWTHALYTVPVRVVFIKQTYTGWPKKVSNYHEASLNRIKTRH